MRICNVLGESVGPLSITLDVATHVISKEAIAVTKSFTKVTTDKTGTLYQVSLDGARRRGFYNLALTAGSQVDGLLCFEFFPFCFILFSFYWMISKFFSN